MYQFLTPSTVRGKVVLLRLDLNVPMKNGEIQELTRLQESVPTLQFLLKHRAKRIHILSHLGRPKGNFDPNYSLQKVAQELEKILKKKIDFRLDFSVGKSLIQMHENVRFFRGEKTNDPAFIEDLLGLGVDIFVQDGFAVCHRAHASVVGVGSFLPSYAGLLVQKEIEQLSPFLCQERIPGLVAIVGGAKLETKVPMIQHFLGVAESVLVGGALANTFWAAKGNRLGKSWYQNEALETARSILNFPRKKGGKLVLPLDFMAAKTPNEKQGTVCGADNFDPQLQAFDIGPKTIREFCRVIEKASVVVWNGPMGIFEQSAFQSGTRSVLQAIASRKSAKTILGGGDTLEALNRFGVDKNAFTHVSTGGGAMLEFLEGKTLPGLEILQTSRFTS